MDIINTICWRLLLYPFLFFPLLTLRKACSRVLISFIHVSFAMSKDMGLVLTRKEIQLAVCTKDEQERISRLSALQILMLDIEMKELCIMVYKIKLLFPV